MSKAISASLFLVFLFFLFNSCATMSPSTEVEYPRLLRKRVFAVIELENKTKYGKRRLSDAASDILVTEMVRSNNFRLIEREKVDALIKEREFQKSDETKYARLGKLLNCEYIIIGSISNFGVQTTGKDMIIFQKKVQKAVAEVDLKVIEVATGEIIFAAYAKGEAEHKVKSTLGIGTTSSYNESLAGDSLRLAISKAVRDLILHFQKG